GRGRLRRDHERDLADEPERLRHRTELGPDPARVLAPRRRALRGHGRCRAVGERPGGPRVRAHARRPSDRFGGRDRHGGQQRSACGGHGTGGGDGADGQLIVLRNGLVDVGAGQFARADVVVDAGRIVSVGVGDESTQSEGLDCTRFAVVPGMVNAHAHSNENWFRGLWDNLPLEPWMLFSYPVLAAPAQSADEIYTRTLLGGIELLRSGATTVVDFLYEDEDSLEPVVRAYRELGLRALIAIGMGDRAYHETVVLDTGLVSRELIERLEREKPPSWDEWSAVTRRAVERFHRPDEGISICP